MIDFFSYLSKFNSKKIICFDGGGVRTIASLVFLKKFEAETKKALMQFEYDLNVKLKELELSAQKELVEKQSETQERIADKKISVNSIAGPPKTEKPKKSFESKGNDVLGGFDLSRFEAK